MVDAMNEKFWNWFFRKVIREEQIILPHLGTFSLCYEPQKTYPIPYTTRIKERNMRYDDEGGYYFAGYSYNDVNREYTHTIHARLRIRFAPQAPSAKPLRN